MKTFIEKQRIAEALGDELSSRREYFDAIVTYQSIDRYFVAITFSTVFIPSRMTKAVSQFCEEYNVSWFISDKCSAEKEHPLYIIIY